MIKLYFCPLQLSR